MRFNIDSTTTTQEALENIKNTKEKLRIKKQEFREAESALAKEFEPQLLIVLKDFFQQVPQIKSISWTQYTPYFMDGDQCYFYVHEVFALNFIPEYPQGYYDEDDLEEGQVAYDSYSIREATELTDEQKTICKNVFDIISSNGDFLEEIYGDHKAITVTADGVQTDDYEHD